MPPTLPLAEYSAVKVVWVSCLTLPAATPDSVALLCPEVIQDSFDTATRSMGTVLGLAQPKVVSGTSLLCYAVDGDNGPIDIRAGSCETTLTVNLVLATSKTAAPVAGDWSVMLEFTD